MHADGRVKTELLPRNSYHPQGPNWSLEGNNLSIRPYPIENEDVEIWFIPSTDIKPHYAEDGLLDGAGVFTFSASDGGWASQILGDVDKREKAYQGCLLRIIESDGRVQERIISTYNEGTVDVLPQAEFRRAFTLADMPSTVTYEVVPSHFNTVIDAVAQGASMNLLVGARRVTKAQHIMLASNFKSAMKTVMDHFTFRQNRAPKKYERSTVDNKDRYGGFYGIR